MQAFPAPPGLEVQDRDVHTGQTTWRPVVILWLGCQQPGPDVPAVLGCFVIGDEGQMRSPSTQNYRDVSKPFAPLAS